jgi:HD-GYP domain-containing protein (c-di-GMP phosphodiesterase class II)
LRRTFLSAINSLVRTLEARDRYTKGHSLRVRHNAILLAAELGLDRRQQKRLSLAAKLHDIGKFGVPEAILNKPGKLSADEFRQIRQHPVIGEKILRPVIHNAEVLAAVRWHHEHFDGGGYPDRLAGLQIPLLARVIAIVDCFDALRTSRPYRKGLSVAESLEIIRTGAGTYFDPHIAQGFIRLAGRNPRVLSPFGTDS